METDPLGSILREWKAPDAPASLDARMLAAYRERRRSSAWQGLWSARISVPVPLLAALLLIAAAVFLEFRAQPTPARPVLRMESQLVSLPEGGGCVTRLNATGFQPLPNGDARVVDAKEIKQ
jgi:hypothetical protein